MDNQRILGKRRDRVIATLLSFKEDHCDRYLPEDVSNALRKQVLDQINDLCDLALDMIPAQSIIYNDLYADRLDEIRSLLLDISEEYD